MFEQRLAEITDFGLFDGYALTADISGYYLHIEIDELERRLLAASRQAAVIADLCELLRVWQLLGIRGLPQGLLPSRPLANLYLTPVDRTLRIDPEVQFIRWMDDLIVTSKGFHHARSVQDRLERQLYALGLSLSAEKTRIVRYDDAYKTAGSAKARLKRLKQSRREEATDWLAEAVGWVDYLPNERDLPDARDLDRDTVLAEYNELLDLLGDRNLGEDFRPRATEAMRELQALDLPHRLSEIASLLQRAPDLTAAALQYVATVGRVEPHLVVTVYQELLDADRFMRDVEKLFLCAAVLRLMPGHGGGLAPSLAGWAREDPHEIDPSASATRVGRDERWWGFRSRRCVLGRYDLPVAPLRPGIGAT